MLRRFHRKWRDGGRLLQAAFARRVLADCESRRACSVVLLPVFVHSLGGLRDFERRCADSKIQTPLRSRGEKSEGRKRKPLTQRRQVAKPQRLKGISSCLIALRLCDLASLR